MFSRDLSYKFKAYRHTVEPILGLGRFCSCAIAKNLQIVSVSAQTAYCSTVYSLAKNHWL